MLQEKRCTVCGKVKDISEYNKRKRYILGVNSWCISCESEYSKEYRRTKNGVINKIYSGQKESSKIRKYNPPTYSNEELKKWITDQPLFDKLFKEWVLSDYKKDLKPSVDRINDYLPYTFSNIQLTTWSENRNKSYHDRINGINNKGSISVVQYSLCGKFINEFYSIKEAERQTKINHRHISEVANGHRKTSGGYVWKHKNTTI